MIPGFENIVEERIKKAQKEGQFDNLEGANKPLKFENYSGPEELKLGYKVLKNAGFLPPEIELKKKITHMEQLLDEAQNDSPNRASLEKKLRFLLNRLDMVRQQSSGFSLLNNPYGNAIRKKLS